MNYPGVYELVTNPINIIFTTIMLFLFIKYKKKDASVHKLPSILVSIGILGTFTGIFIGLLNFDVAQINKSIPQLLSGLKTAFYTSILGLILSTWIKVRSAIQQMNSVDKDNEKKLLETPQEILTNISSDLKKLNKSLTGDEDLTILTQIQKFRLSFEEKLTQQNNFIKSVENKMGAISEYLGKNLSLSSVYQDRLNQITGLLTEIKEVSRNLEVSVTLAPELEERFMNLIKNSESLINIASENKNSIEAILYSVTDPYEDGILMILDKLLSLVSDFDENIKFEVAVPEKIDSLNINMDRLSNDLEKLLFTNKTMGEGSYFDILQGIDKIRISNYAILDELKNNSRQTKPMYIKPQI